jgi:hypothetical protein
MRRDPEGLPLNEVQYPRTLGHTGHDNFVGIPMRLPICMFAVVVVVVVVVVVIVDVACNVVCWRWAYDMR